MERVVKYHISIPIYCIRFRANGGVVLGGDLAWSEAIVWHAGGKACCSTGLVSVLGGRWTIGAAWCVVSA